MSPGRKSLVVLFLTICPLVALNASQPSLRLGSVSFPVSCEPSVQASFDRGIALLHSFGYEAADAQFKQIETKDPQCAMAYWGDAMTIWHQLWDRPTQDDLQRGYSLIQKAETIGAKTEREREYIQALAAFYTNNPKANFNSRTAAYSEALQRLHRRFPGDGEAGTFYALSLIASPDADKNDLAYRKKAVSILNAVFSRHPNHPGAAHYLIHACDNPEMAKEGLPAATRKLLPHLRTRSTCLLISSRGSACGMRTFNRILPRDEPPSNSTTRRTACTPWIF